MQFKVESHKRDQYKKYNKTDLDVAFVFAKKAYKEFGSFVKAIVLFGSTARRAGTSTTKDIDILVVVNDITTVLSGEVVETYRVIMEKLVPETSAKIHLTTLRLTNFWDLVRNGDPLAINILRDGVALIDTGFFDPLQVLLYKGKIRPTFESIYAYYTRAPNTLLNSKWHVLQATLDLYWAVIDSSHAALMKLGEIPPSPAHVSQMLEEKMVKKKLLPKKHAKTMKKMFDISKGIASRDIKHITGKEFDVLYKDAHDFVEFMKRFIEKK